MPNPVQFTVTAGALPEGVNTDPQGLLNLFASRLIIAPSVPWSSFVMGAAQPTSDVGPWFKDGVELWVWSDTAASYVPQRISQLALRYIVSATAPSATDYTLWVDTTSPGALKVHDGSDWVDVYAAKFAAYSTTTETATAITNAIKSYPVRVGLSTDQTVNMLGAGNATKLLFNDVDFDPHSVYDIANSRYVAPVSGIYAVSVELQVDNGTGVAASMELSLEVQRNGGNATSSGMSVGSPPGGRWYPQTNTLIELSQGDVLETGLTASDGTNTGNVVVASGGGFKNSTLCVHLVQKL